MLSDAVHKQVILLMKLPGAMLTLVSKLRCMDPHVQLQIAFCGKLFVANNAREISKAAVIFIFVFLLR